MKQEREQDTHLDFTRLVKLLRVVEGAWVIAVFEYGSMRQKIIEQLRKALIPLQVIEISLAQGVPDPLEILQRMQTTHPEAVVCFTGISNALDKGLSGYLDLQRESLSTLPFRLVFWATNHDVKMMSREAPNFYSRISGIFRFEEQPHVIKDTTSRNIVESRKESINVMNNTIRGDIISVGAISRSGIVLGNSNTSEQALSSQIHYLKRRIDALETHSDSAALATRALATSWYQLADLYGKTRSPDWNKASHAYTEAAGYAAAVGDRVLQADSLLQAGRSAFQDRSFDHAVEQYQASLVLYRELGDHTGEADVLRELGNVYQMHGNVEQGLQSYESALALYRAVEDRMGQANVWQAIGDIQQFRKDLDAALQSYDTALTLYRAVEDRVGQANVWRAIGDIQQFREQMDAALQSYDTALTLYRAVEDRVGQANVWQAIGDIQQFRGDFSGAFEHYHIALAFYRELGERLGEAHVLRAIGNLQQQREELDAALANYHVALALYRELGDRLGEAQMLRVIGDVEQFRRECDAVQEH